MELHSIPSAGGAKKRKKRLGSGPGSGLGKTCGKGHKGQLARSGCSIRLGFEGGQMPLYRKLPRRGFSNFLFKTVYQVVNVEDLDRFDSGSHVDAKALSSMGLVRDPLAPVKLLAKGDLSKKLTVEVDSFSDSAKHKVESVGGTCSSRAV